MSLLFFFNETATTEIYTLSLHDALPISVAAAVSRRCSRSAADTAPASLRIAGTSSSSRTSTISSRSRSEEHTSELQSRQYLVCRLLLEKTKQKHHHSHTVCSHSSSTEDP